MELSEITIRLNKVRMKKGISLDDLSAMTGLSRAYINYIENGDRNPKLSVVCELAKALGVGLDDLFEF